MSLGRPDRQRRRVLAGCARGGSMVASPLAGRVHAWRARLLARRGDVPAAGIERLRGREHCPDVAGA